MAPPTPPTIPPMIGQGSSGGGLIGSGGIFGSGGMIGLGGILGGRHFQRQRSGQMPAKMAIVMRLIKSPINSAIRPRNDRWIADNCPDGRPTWPIAPGLAAGIDRDPIDLPACTAVSRIGLFEPGFL